MLGTLSSSVWIAGVISDGIVEVSGDTVGIGLEAVTLAFLVRLSVTLGLKLIALELVLQLAGVGVWRLPWWYGLGAEGLRDGSGNEDGQGDC